MASPRADSAGSARRALQQPSPGADNLDLKAISGHHGWLRLRVG
jgi:hypothetical protein